MSKYRLDFIFYFLFGLMAFFVAYHPAFGVIDDHTLINTLLAGKHIPLFVMPDIGRFYPLDGQELNVLSSIFSVDPKIFYVFNAICIFIVAFCLSQSFFLIFSSRMTYPKIWAYITTVLIFLSPASISSWLRLFVPERMEFVFLSIFLYTYVLLYFKATKHRKIYFALCVLSSLIALFYKETAFLLIGVFAFCHIAFSWWNKEKINKIDFFLLANVAIWIICYVVFVVMQKTSVGMYGDTPYNRLMVLLKDLVNYTLNDPILTVGMFSVLCMRIVNFCRLKKFDPLFDSMLISSIIFIASYLVLGLSSLHYSLPAYIFAIPVFFCYVYKYLRSRFLKFFVGLTVLLLCLNYLPLSVYTAIHYKFVPQNFQNTLSFLKTYAQDKNVNIYLEGVNRASGLEVYVSFQKWMEYYGIKNFDFFSDLPIDNVLLGKSNPQSAYSVFRSQEIIAKKSGDLVILTPYSSLIIDQGVIHAMQNEYRLLYVSEKGINIPLLSLRALAKWIGIQMTKESDYIFNRNVFGLPIYFYVFEVK